MVGALGIGLDRHPAGLLGGGRNDLKTDLDIAERHFSLRPGVEMQRFEGSEKIPIEGLNLPNLGRLDDAGGFFLLVQYPSVLPMRGFEVFDLLRKIFSSILRQGEFGLPHPEQV